MIQEVRIYKRFDTDLIALCASGFPVTDMMKEAIVKFANGIPVKFDIGPASYFDMNGKKNVRLRISISDKNAIEVLKNIKHGYRNSFCKSVLRNALAKQNLSAFFADESFLRLCSGETVSNVTPVSKTVVNETISLQEPFVLKESPVLHSPASVQPLAAPVETTPVVKEPVIETTVTYASVPAQAETPAASDADVSSILDAFDAL